MDIRKDLDGLRSILGVNQPAFAATGARNEGAAQGNSLDSDRATFSSAGSEVSQAASESGIRADKVAPVQAALAAGTYNVPAAAVASRIVDAMLSGGR